MKDFEQAGSGVTTIDGFYKFIENAATPAVGKNIIIALAGLAG